MSDRPGPRPRAADELPPISGPTFSARYVPGAGNAVGGDWHAVFPCRGIVSVW
ncbi:hypothetical protein [Actinokineospora spheciospongiae]|uniref:hypothetical protein n=1 Tax=Actinokineospora spheciospongiae TaxID=909613 RepID=UPI002D7716DC|nr:hypothetical protein [Actinokineospora spheciospongiae]